MNRRAAREDEWKKLRKKLPADLDGSAREFGGVRRPLRNLKSPERLLRLLLVYANGNWSLRDVCVWAAGCGIATLTGSALQEHVATAGPWLAHLLGVQLVALAKEMPPGTFGNLTVLIGDGSTANRPGKKGTDYRIHLLLNLGAVALADVVVTTAKEGETLAHFQAQVGQLVVADRGYAFRSSIWSVVKTGARLLVRINWQNLPLLDRAGAPLGLLELARGSSEERPLETPVVVAADAAKHIPAVEARLVIVRKPFSETLKSRQALCKEGKRKGRTPRQETLAAAEFVFLLTTATLAELPTAMVPVLYRWRWQIELYIKRCKSLLGLDEIRVKTDASMATVLYAKLLATATLHRLYPMTQGQELDSDLPEGAMKSIWRTWKLLWEGFKDALGGHLSLSEWLQALPLLEERLAEAPRRRTLARQRQYQRMCDEIGWDAASRARGPTD